MKKQKELKNRNFFLLILFLFSTSLISLRTLKEVNVQDIRISGSDLFSKNDLLSNSSLNFPIRLINIKTNFLEKELKQNLSLKHISVQRQIIPFGLNIRIQTRTPIAFGERIVNEEKILGFIDKDGIFINKQNAENINLIELSIQVVGWKEKFKKTLSKIFIAQDNYDLEITKITFTANGFVILEEKDLKKIFLGFDPNLINYQLQIIKNLKKEFKDKNFPQKIDNIDLTYPNKPKIKVFKP